MISALMVTSFVARQEGTSAVKESPSRVMPKPSAVSVCMISSEEMLMPV